eukprot:gb/GECH01011914.1/.p1 GENE.gb/GECH01011914.1/~~gb/GECH01011914.1/.p1  ORF type:complete len:412 (+),score=103.72 gb/GECH01011914.1/:1-1236(+)
MARKKKKVDKKATPEPSEEVENSMAGSDSEGEGEVVDTTGPEDRLPSAVDMLSERRSRTRIEGLTLIKELLLHHDITEALVPYETTLVEAATSSLRRGRPQEAVLGAEVLAGLALWQGIQAEELVDGHAFASTSVALAVEALHTAAAHGSTRSPAVRAAAFVSLGLWHFACPETETVTEEAVDFVETHGWAETNPSDVLAAAVRCWTLLMSVLPESERGQRLHSLEDRLIELMESADACVVEEAGWAVGLLAEAGWTDAGGGGGMPAGIIDAVTDRAKESSKTKSRKERSAQRSLFRDVQATLEEGGDEDETGEKFVIAGRELMLVSWEKRVRMRYFRRIVGGGILTHLRSNPLVRGALDIDFDLSTQAPSLSKWEKKMMLSDKSNEAKQRTINRQSSRRNAAASAFEESL